MKVLGTLIWNGRIVCGFFNGVQMDNGHWGVNRDEIMAAFREKFGYDIPDGSTYTIM